MSKSINIFPPDTRTFKKDTEECCHTNCVYPLVYIPFMEGYHWLKSRLKTDVLDSQNWHVLAALLLLLRFPECIVFSTELSSLITNKIL